MWYDKGKDVPEYGSPLESVFVQISLSRQRSDLMSTRALVQTMLPEGKESSDSAIKAFQEYCDAMFPFLEKAGDSERVKMREALNGLLKYKVKLDKRPIYEAKMQMSKRMKSLRRVRLNRELKRKL